MPIFGANNINYGNAAQNNYLQNNNNNTQLGHNGGTQPSGGAGAGGMFGTGNNSGIGWNTDTLKVGLGGIQTLGNLWNAWQDQNLAKEQFEFQKGVTNTNMASQLKSYNTSLEDRIRARGFTEGQSQNQMDDYTSRNRLERQA